MDFGWPNVESGRQMANGQLLFLHSTVYIHTYVCMYVHTYICVYIFMHIHACSGLQSSNNINYVCLPVILVS